MRNGVHREYWYGNNNKKQGARKAPCKIHTDNSVNGYAVIYNSRNCFVSIHSPERLTMQR